jgi:hypothetical protein
MSPDAVMVIACRVEFTDPVHPEKKSPVRLPAVTVSPTLNSCVDPVAQEKLAGRAYAVPSTVT